MIDGPKRKKAFSTYGGPVLRGGQEDEAQFVASLFDCDEGLARAMTHGFHPYAARLHPHIVRRAIARFSAPGQWVVDPFCGSGTTVVEALLAGREAIGIDASPLAVELSRTKTDPLGEERRQAFVDLAVKIAEESADRARGRQRPPKVPVWARRSDRVFAPNVFLELLGLRQAIWEGLPSDKRVARAMRMAFSSILSKFMLPTQSDTDRQPDRRIGRGIPSDFFASRCGELARALRDFENALDKRPEKSGKPKIVSGDACELPPDLAADTVDLIVTSPPYAGTYDYGGLHAVRYTWLHLQKGGFNKTQIGAPTTQEGGIGTAPRAWANARKAWLGQIANILKPEGRALFAVGDGVIGTSPEDALQMTAETAISVGLQPVAWASQDRPSRDQRIRDTFGPLARREHLLLVQKTNA